MAYDAMYPQSAIALTVDGEAFVAYTASGGMIGKIPGWQDIVA